MNPLIIFSFLLFFIFTSCKFGNVNGLYYSKGGFEMGSSIKINNDSTFFYKWQNGIIGGETKGKWTRMYNILILNSENQLNKDTLPDFIIRNQYDSEFDTISYRIIGIDLMPLPSTYCSVFEKGKKILEITGDNDGKIKFHKVKYDSIKIQFYGFRNIVLKSGFKNNIEIIAREMPEFGYEYFKGKVLKIRRGKLIFKTRNTYYFEKIYKMKRK